MQGAFNFRHAMSNTLYTLIGRTRPALVAFALGAAVSGVLALASHAQSQNTVSQKGRQFQPSELTIKRGETVLIVNDDADLRHHAYIDSAQFKFDSGDQEPGSKTTVRFPVAGIFEVLCAIHPKMKLTVHVN